MGVSFKVARLGIRYSPRPLQIDQDHEANESFDEGNFKGVGEQVIDVSNVLLEPRLHSDFDDIEVSFSLNLFPNGFSIGEVSEILSRAPEQLFPYNRESETLFSAIEYGYLPGDAFYDLPVKYVNGSVLCQIRDYRNCFFCEEGICLIKKSPIVHRVSLKMSMENVVKDVLSMADDSWTYQDLLEFESRVLLALQPVLYQHPQPLKKKVNLEISWSWKKREKPYELIPNMVLNDLNHVTDTPENLGPKSNFTPGLALQDKGVMFATTNIGTTLPTKHSDSCKLMSPPSSESSQTKDTPSLANQNEHNVYKRKPTKRACDRSKQRSSNLSARAKRLEHEIPGSVPKKPKNKPLDKQEFPKKTTETSDTLQLQHNNYRAHNEEHRREPCSSQLNRTTPLANAGDILNSHPRLAANHILKREPVETCCPSSNFKSINENHLCRRRMANPSCGVPVKNQQPSSPSIKTNNPLSETPQNSIQPLNCTSQCPHQLSTTWQKSAIRPFSETMQNLAIQPTGDRSEIDRLSTLERLRKIQDTTQRNIPITKRKLDQYMRNQPFPHSVVEDSSSDKTSLSKISYTNSNAPYVRTLSFVLKQSMLNQEESERHVRLVLQKLNNNMVEAKIIYGCEDNMNSTIVSLVPTFPTSHSADLFASQFTSLIAREGYELTSDQAAPMSLNNADKSTHQQFSNNTTNRSAVRFDRSSIRSNMSPLNSSQLLPNTRNVQRHMQFMSNVEAQLSPLPLQLDESVHRYLQLQQQRQDRVRQQERLMQIKAMLGWSNGGGTSVGVGGSFQPGNGNVEQGDYGVLASRTGIPLSSELASSTPNHLDAHTGSLMPLEGHWRYSRRSSGLLLNSSGYQEAPRISRQEMQWPQQSDNRSRIENIGSINPARNAGSSITSVGSLEPVVQQSRVDKQSPIPGSAMVEEMTSRTYCGKGESAYWW